MKKHIVSINVDEAAKKSFKNRADIEKSEKCGCYQCGKIFVPSLIKKWGDEDMTALCPFCGIDSVVADVQNFPVIKTFMRRMRDSKFSQKD